LYVSSAVCLWYLVFVALMLHSSFRPYSNPIMNWTEFFALVRCVYDTSSCIQSSTRRTHARIERLRAWVIVWMGCRFRYILSSRQCLHDVCVYVSSSGFFYHTARMETQGSYKTIKTNQVTPRSALELFSTTLPFCSFFYFFKLYCIAFTFYFLMFCFLYCAALLFFALVVLVHASRHAIVLST
jgi:hypothetical protein